MKAKCITIAIVIAIVCAFSAVQVWAGDPLSTTTFTPAYPSGASYDAAVASLPGLGLLPDGTTNRCDTNGEAELVLVISTFNVVGAAEFLCAADSEPITKAACYGTLYASALANESAGVAQAQCDFQDGIIDGAEIEAAYENTVILHDDLGLHDDRLITHDQEVQAKLDELIGKVDLVIARQLETIRLLNTPSGQRSTDVPACDGQPCSWNPE